MPVSSELGHTHLGRLCADARSGYVECGVWRVNVKRALIVDDVVENRYMLRVLLEGRGYAVIEAAHGQAALDAARLQRPDIIVSDLMMPVMDGYALLRA